MSNPSYLKLSEGFSGQRSVIIPQVILDEAISDPILSLLHINAIGYYPRASNHYRNRSTPIEEYILIYCVDGSGWFKVNGKTFEVPSNSFFILPAGIPHSYGADTTKPWTIYWIHFEGRFAATFAEGCFEPFLIPASSDMDSKTATDIFEEIFTLLDSNFTIAAMRYSATLLYHYLGILRFSKEYSDPGNRSSEQNIIERAIFFLEENIERQLPLSALSKYTGLSPSYLTVLFKQMMGHPPMAFFRILKIKKACRLLSETDMKINTVCHKVGIKDPYYFSRLFTKLMGISPSAYRNNSTI